MPSAAFPLIQNQVTATFNAVLLRAPSAAELASWATQVDSGLFSLTQVAVALETSAEGTGGTLPVVRLFQTFFGRAPDAAGLKYWENILPTTGATTATLNAIATGFTGSAEFTNLYGTAPTADSFVTALYQNVLNRAADAGGRAYWINQLGGAGATATLAQDAAVAVQFAQSAEFISNTTTNINNWLTAAATVGQNASTATTAGTPTYTSGKGVATGITNAVSTFTFMPGTDNLTGTSGNDTFNATATTFTAGDKIDGVSGTTDTLNLTTSGTTPAVTIANIEVINLTASPNPVTMDLTGVTKVTDINNVNSANGATVTVTGVGNVVNTAITNSQAATTITYTTAAVAGTADAETLTLSGAAAGSSFTTNGVETITVASTGSAANVLTTLTDAAITRLNVTGSAGLTITNAVGGTTIATVDASAATGAVNITTGNGAGGVNAVGVTVTGPTATTGSLTVTTGLNNDTITTGPGNATVTAGAGNDTINAGAGTNTIDTGAGNDTVNLTTGTDTIRMSTAAAGTNSDTLNAFTTKDIISINLGTAQTTTAAATAVYGTVQTGATSPTFAGVAGTGTGTAIVFQTVAAATATANTIALASNVVALNSVFTDGTAAGVVTALGFTATTGVTTAAASRFLLVTYSTGNIAQVWSYGGDTTVNTDIDAAELSLVATLTGVAQNSLTAANFSTYLATTASGATVSNTGQTITLSGTLNTLQSTANTAGQFLTAGNDTINVGVGTLPTAAPTATTGLTIIDPSSTDADVLNGTVLGDWAAGSVVSGIETINLNMLVAGTAFSASAKTPGTTTFGLTGTQNFTVTGYANNTATTLGAGYTGTATATLLTDSGTADTIIVNLAGSTASSDTAGASFVYLANTNAVETATVNVTANSGIRMGGAGLFGVAASVTAINLAGSGNLNVWGTPANLDTMILNGSGVAYAGALTLTAMGGNGAAIDFSAGGIVTGIRTIDVSNITAAQAFTAAHTITLPTVTTGATLTITDAPTTAIVNLTGLTVVQSGSGLSDSLTVSLGANAAGELATGGIVALGTETLTISSAAASTTSTAILNVQLADAAGTQTVTVTGAGNFTLGNVTADTLTTSGVTGTVSATLIQATAGSVFNGGAGNTTIVGTAQGDVITTGAGNDNVTGGKGADVINVGVGTDNVIFGATSLAGLTAGAASNAVADVITGMAFGAGNDVYQMSVTLGQTNLRISSGGDVAIANATAVVVQHQTATGPFVFANATNVLVIDTTIATAAALKTAIEAVGTYAMTLGTAGAAINNDYMIVWTDGTNSHISLVNDADGGGNTVIAAGDITVSEIATLIGVTSVANAVAANFAFIT